MSARDVALRAHQKDRARELNELALLLEQDGLTPNAGPLRAAAAECLGPSKIAGVDQPDAGAAYWGYSIDGLEVRLEEQRHCRPRRAVSQPASGILAVSVEEYVPPTAAEVGQSWELIRRLDVDFYVDVYQDVAGSRLPLRAAWHVDTHRHVDQDSHSVHPRFHFQVGGERLDALDADIRAVFMPEAPRLNCAPLDAVLALDFVLSHYSGVAWSVLQDGEPRYRRLRAAPMRRYWQPYYLSIGNALANLSADQTGGTAVDLLPNMAIA